MKREDKREKILAAAEEIMSRKSLSEAKISEIARKAGVADSVIYQYFEGKEALLFSIPGERMKEILFLLEEQLQAIRDPESRLRKMIWFHLRYNDTHLGYARILFLECRSSREFYLSPAYQLVRKYAGILLGILKQGVEDGQFRENLDVRLTRDIILGALAEETVSSLTRGETEETVSDLEDIMSLVHAMIIRTGEDKTSKTDKILMAAEKIFAEKGFTKATILEIAQLAQVSEGTVSDYFENKEALLLSLPVKRFNQYLEELPETFTMKNPIRKLRRFIKYHFLLFLTKREFLKVFLLQIQLNKQFYGSKAFESFWKYFRVIEEIIEEGKSEGVFRSDVNPRVFRNLFLGAFSNVALRWVILEGDHETDKMKELMEVTELLTLAVVTKEGHGAI